MKALLFIGGALSALAAIFFAVTEPRQGYVFESLGGDVLELEPLEADPYGLHLIRCPARPNLHGQTAPLLIAVERIDKAGFRHRRC